MLDILILLVGPLGPLELAVIIYFLCLWLVPAAALYWVAKQRGRSGWWAWWALLSWLGFLVGILMLVASPRLSKAESSAAPSGDGNAADNLRTLGELRERGLLTDEEFQERRERELKRL